MIIISRGQVDSSVIVGIVVVLAIVSVLAFSVYYFGFVKPEQAELEDAKDSAEQTLNSTLGKVSTSQAEQAASTYMAEIQQADTKSEVTSIVEDISSTFQSESKRETLLNKENKLTSGEFYSLDSLSEDLENRINSKSTLSGLESLEDGMKEEIKSAWMNLHQEDIGDISSEEGVMLKKNSALSETHYESKEKAYSFIQGKSLELLRKLKFKGKGTFEVPVISEFKSVPSIGEGDKVNVYEYLYENDVMNTRAKNAEVLEVIYPKNVLSSVSWTRNDNGDAYSYSTDVWEEIKARLERENVAGFPGTRSEWSNWAENVVSVARDKASVGDFDLQAIYLLEISNNQIAENIVRTDRYRSGERDVVILGRR